MEADPKARVRAAFDTLREGYLAEPYPDLAARRDRLTRLERMVRRAERRIVEAIDADFGGRPAIETRIAETGVAIGAARRARKHLGGWMAERPAATSPLFWPLRNSVLPTPLGVVGIIAPWNYPAGLLLMPLIDVLAAGNRALVKPAERTPRTSALISELIGQTFAADEVAVVEGAGDVAEAVTRLPLDHLVFTGSEAIGLKVAAAAAESLVPVTLELGGKSPAIIDPSADLDRAARKIAFGKWFNAGQTCIAPDTVFAPAALIEDVAGALATAAAALYPDAGGNRDYASQIDARAAARQRDMLAEAEAAGARMIRPAGPDGEGNRIAPAIVVGAPEMIALRREEIFGPILPIVACESAEDAERILAAGPRPLALYWFGTDRAAETRIAERVPAGGMTVNETLLQNVQQSLPFGGVGASGQGHYHGIHGFDRFSKLKPVTRRRGGPDTSGYAQPPYGGAASLLARALRRML